jgi:hypothetical protein
MVVMYEPEQMVCDDGVATAFGAGLINTVAVIEVPGQPLAIGVIVNVTVTGALVMLVNIPLIFPVPLAAMPVSDAVLFLVQLNEVPTKLLVKAMLLIAEPEQIV